jgi:hypothetical protein
MAALEASNDLTVKNGLKLADYPLIDDEMDAPLVYRCVIAATIGCDTLPGGVHGWASWCQAVACTN